MYQETILHEYIPPDETSKKKSSPRKKECDISTPNFDSDEEYFRFRFHECLFFSQVLVDFVNNTINIPEVAGFSEFFWYLVENLNNRGTPKVLVPEMLIAAFTGKKVHSKRTRVKQFLNLFKKSCIDQIGGSFKVNRFEWKQGKCYSIQKTSINFGKFHDQISKLSSLEATEMIFISSGTRATHNQITRNQKSCEEYTLQQGRRFETVPEVDRFKKYLNELPANFLSKRFRKYTREAKNEIESLGLDEIKYHHQIQTINRIIRNPEIQYDYSKSRKSLRLYAQGVNLANGKREVRSIFLKGCPECDIKCAQLGIGSAIFGFDQIHAFLSDPKNNYNIWGEIIPRDVPDSEYNFVKSRVKIGVYSCLYHMERNKIFFMLLDSLKKLLEPQRAFKYSQSIVNSWVFNEVLEKTAEYSNKLNSGEKVRDAYGRQFSIEDKFSAASLMSCLAQSYEFKILQPAFDYIMSCDKLEARTEVRIALFQFDGFHLWCRDNKRKEYYKSKIQEKIREGILNIKREEGIYIPVDIEWK